MSFHSRRFGKYELQEPLGRGGMAEVWKALDSRLSRHVAIKFLHANLQEDPNFSARFTREARVVAGLRHPNIAQIYDFDIVEGGEGDTFPANATAYMVMEYIQGQSLAQYLHNTSYKQIFPSGAEVIQLFTPLSLALDYAHQQGVIHRDIKPANILLDSRRTLQNAIGEPLLVDFGLAKVQNAETQTLSGEILGTPLYIAPEQLQGRPASAQSDIYALGAILYEMVTGVQPFRGEVLTFVFMKHLTETPTAPHLLNPQLPPAISDVIMQSLAKDPDARFPSATAMTIALAQAFNISLPEYLKQVATGQNTILMSASQVLSPPKEPTPVSSPDPGNQSPPARVILEEQSKDVASTQSMPNTVPPGQAETDSNPIRLPDSDPYMRLSTGAPLQKQGSAPEVLAQTPTNIEAAPAKVESTPSSMVISPVSPPTHPKRGKLRLVLAALLVFVLLTSGLSAFLLLTQHHSPVAAGTVIGNAFFLSSGKQSFNNPPGNNDEFQIDLQNTPGPSSGKSYYAWLLPDKNQSESPPVFLGTLTINRGKAHLFYPGDSQHTNLLAITSRFLVTEENANEQPLVPSPDLSTWRYYAELPQTPAPGQTYGVLAHLRHLLANDPTLEKYSLFGGLSVWAYHDTQQLLTWANNAKEGWNAKDFPSVHRLIISILDYLDGASLVQQDVPPGTPILADPHIAQVGLLEFDPNSQKAPGYLYHIALHLNGVLASPGATQFQRDLATRINSALNSVKGALEQMRYDASVLVRQNNTELASISSLNQLNDLVTQANNAFMGQSNPPTLGISQMYQDIQRLATFEVKPYM
ncbi:MAG TPA: protein kinase [Ktedonobacteraceae bacterium]|jgi:serine/threonine protein kinase|nr:protein kinase [Ktedonobacteraceae bacterium]